MSKRLHGAQTTQPNNADLYGGIILIFAAVVALVVANSPLGPRYFALLQTIGEVRLGSLELSKTVDHWVNDGLMAVFFLLIALEIKREVMQGALSGIRKAVLPILAAIGGFVIPAGIYSVANWGDPTALHGWAVPSATDIAFAVGVCAMLGSRLVPGSLKTFLLALAIIDDLMAIVVIAMFYTAELSTTALILAGIGVLILIALNLLNIRASSLYFIVGLVTWACVLKSGVHATLAGVAVGLAIPLKDGEEESMLERIEHALKPWVSYGIVPVFALANAGVSLGGLAPSNLAAPIPFGIIGGLFVGKQLGVFGASALAIKLGLAPMPEGANYGNLYGVAALTGIGFTMSLFIGTLAFNDEAVLAQVRIAVLVASFCSAVAGAAILILARRRAKPGF